MTKEELSITPYKELQGLAKELGLQFVGVSKTALADSIFEETNHSIDSIPEVDEPGPRGKVEQYTPEEVEPKRPTITTTKTVTEGVGILKDTVPKVKFKTKTVRIKPRKDTPVSYIGTEKWQLKKGKVYEVPENVADIFENAGYL